jgi:hypothetical protein
LALVGRDLDGSRILGIGRGDRRQHLGLVEQHRLIDRDICGALLRGAPEELGFQPGDLLAHEHRRLALRTDFLKEFALLGFERLDLRELGPSARFMRKVLMVAKCWP